MGISIVPSPYWLIWASIETTFNATMLEVRCLDELAILFSDISPRLVGINFHKLQLSYFMVGITNSAPEILLLEGQREVVVFKRV